MPTVPPVTFNNDVEIPQVGFGVFLVPEAETKAAVASALEVGYRHIDTARAYDNEAAVGAAVAESGIDLDELFVTTKCWNSDHGYDKALEAFDASLKRLGLDYLDRPMGESAASGCRTSTSRTSNGSSTGPTSSRPSTRSSCTPGCSNANSARSMTTMGSGQRLGARSAEAATISPTP